MWQIQLCFVGRHISSPNAVEKKVLSLIIFIRKNIFQVYLIPNVFGQYRDQIHYVFNKLKKYLFTYKCDGREYS